MIKLKEITLIILASLFLAFSITLLSDMNLFAIILISIFIIILINLIVKKIIAFFFETEIEARLWEFKRWGIKPWMASKKSFPAGIVFPILTRILLLPLNGFCWMASLVFEEKAKVYKAAKRHGIYSFTEISEQQIAIIAGAGILASLISAFIGYLVGYTEFSRLSIWFALFNMIPISNLDGNKIFFGNKVLWSFLALLTLIAFAYSLLLI